MARTSVLLALLLVVAGCGASGRPACSGGRTELDGVCIDERVADFVACVRAKGAELGSERSERLAVEAQYAGARAAAADEVKDRLEKRYGGSDVTELEVIRACSALHGMSDPQDGSGNAAVERVDCARASAWRSAPTHDRTEIEFVNGAAEPMNLYWLDFGGSRVHFQTLEPQTSYVQSTLVSHPWIAVGASGRCYGAIMARQAGRHRVEIR